MTQKIEHPLILSGDRCLVCIKNWKYEGRNYHRYCEKTDNCDHGYKIYDVTPRLSDPVKYFWECRECGDVGFDLEMEAGVDVKPNGDHEALRGLEVEQKDTWKDIAKGWKEFANVLMSERKEMVKEIAKLKGELLREFEKNV